MHSKRVTNEYKPYYINKDETILRYYSLLKRQHVETFEQDCTLSSKVDVDELKNEMNCLMEMSKSSLGSLTLKYSTKSFRVQQMASSNQELGRLLRMYNVKHDSDVLCDLFILTIHGRDIHFGNGERFISYQHVLSWYHAYPYLGEYLLRVFVTSIGNKPIGSWRDVREVAYYVLSKTNNKKHPLIRYCSCMIAEQMVKDSNQQDIDGGVSSGTKSGTKSETQTITMAAKWCPRERGKHKWFFRMIAMEFYRLKWKKDPQTRVHAYKVLRSHTDTLSRKLNTLERNMALRNYRDIVMNEVPLMAQIKHLEWFIKKGTIEKNKMVERIKRDLEVNPEKLIQTTISIPYYHLVKYSIKFYHYDSESPERQYVNALWKMKFRESITNDKKQTLYNTLPILDLSRHMENNTCVPLYTAMGMAIHAAHISTGIIKGNILLYCTDIQWIDLQEYPDIVELINYILSVPRGMYSTAHVPIMPIAYMLSEAKLSNSALNTITLVFFSNLFHDDIATYNDFIFSMNEYAKYPPKCVFFHVGTQSSRVSSNHYSLISLIHDQPNYLYVTGDKLSTLVYMLKNGNRNKTTHKTEEKPSIFKSESIITPMKRVRKIIEYTGYKDIYNHCYDYLFNLSMECK